jgi:hypothetical protein
VIFEYFYKYIFHPIFTKMSLMSGAILAHINVHEIM